MPLAAKLAAWPRTILQQGSGHQLLGRAFVHPKEWEGLLEAARLQALMSNEYNRQEGGRTHWKGCTGHIWQEGSSIDVNSMAPWRLNDGDAPGSQTSSQESS